MTCQIHIKQKMCGTKIFQFQSQWIFLVKKFGLSCLASVINTLSNPDMKIQQVKNQFNFAGFDNEYIIVF